MVIVSIWWLGGLFIDGWAHSNIPQLETFFTPWHAVFYSGYLAVAFTLLAQVFLNVRQSALTSGQSTSFGSLLSTALKDQNWLRAIPKGYDLTLLGLVVFGICGIGDMTWHIFLGIERSTEALLSPTHLGLALGIALALTGPLRAAWRRSGAAPSWRQLGPVIFSLTFTFSLLTFFTSYASPLISPWPLLTVTRSATDGITAILLNTAIMMGCVLLIMRRWRLPFGTFAFMLGLNGVLMLAFHPRAALIAVPTALLGGLAADLVYRFLQPSLDQPERVRLFAFLVPLMFYILYFIDLSIVGPIAYESGIQWSAPFWAGAPVIAGFVGLLLSFVLLPPQGAPEEE
ncbi:hypothetical protein KSC_096970 [Ktedonobacter sp. SOSP1-52]|uniref:hypothetical protein n=1 Tax=Ktedonobacter sp. SOSP1-52 TaxID=2778366 RepID=UPI0019154724|nr:hypothetical protein [Ktedonobacter sp. SOSP1-52]GHO70805.1 hypothetical protein KSC_096970 [Ktedonobacter sp. SOSP1-52]